VKFKTGNHNPYFSFNALTARQPRHIEFALMLLNLGIIPPGQFSMIEIRHDDDCPRLSTPSGLNCTCDCEIVVGGRSYLYSEFFNQSCR